MRKGMILVICLVLVAAFASPVFAAGLGLGFDYAMSSGMNGSLSGISVDHTDPGGIGFTLSYFGNLTKNIELGGGATYYLERQIKNMSINGVPFTISTDANFGLIPIFGRLKYVFNPKSEAQFFLGGDLRYALMNISGAYWTGCTITGGLGYGIFGGLSFGGGLEVELGYIMQNSSIYFGAPINMSESILDNYLYIKGGFVI